MVGIDSVAEGIKTYGMLKETTSLGTFYNGDMKEILLTSSLQKMGNQILLLLTLLGMELKKVVEQIMEIEPKRVVYVSCNSKYKLEI